MAVSATEPAKIALDVAAGSVAVAALMEWLPPIAAALSIIWLSIQVGEWCWKKWKAYKDESKKTN